MERFNTTYMYGIYKVIMNDGYTIRLNAGSEQLAVGIVLDSVRKLAPVSAIRSCKLEKVIPL